MNENLSYGMESYQRIKNNELIQKLKQQDEHFEQFCLGIYGSEKAKEENQVALKEDLVYFLSGFNEIKEIITDLIKRLNEATDEKEKAELLEELKSWRRERDDYYNELAKIEKQIQSESQQKDSKLFLEDDKVEEYARMIYLITVYDEQKKKLDIEGNVDITELESRIRTLHSIQEKLNLLYQTTYRTEELLEETDVIPRMRNEGETEEAYRTYLYQFYHREIDLEELNNITIVEEEPDVMPTQPKEENLVYSDGYADGLTVSLSEKLKNLENYTPFDVWTNHLETILSTPWVIKIFAYFDERVEKFKKVLDCIQEARINNKIGESDADVLEAMLSNGGDMAELELTNSEDFNQNGHLLEETLQDYKNRTYRDMDINSQDIEFFSRLSSLFQAIYIYEKGKKEYFRNPTEEIKTSILNSYEYINRHANQLFHVDNFISKTDLPFELTEDEKNQYTSIFVNIPEEKEQTDVVPFVFDSPEEQKPIIEEQNDKYMALQEDYETLRLRVQALEMEISRLKEENVELKKERNYLKQKVGKGSPFKVIRKKAHDLWERVNKKKILYSAVMLVSFALLGVSASKWKSGLDMEESIAEESRAMDLLNKNKDKLDSNIVGEIENAVNEGNNLNEDMHLEITLPSSYDAYTGPKIGDIVKMDFGANTYTDFLVDRDPNTVNVNTGLRRVYKGNYNPDTEMVVLKVAMIHPDDGTKAIIATSNEEIKKLINEGYKPLSAAVSLNTDLKDVADGLYATNSKQVNDNVTFYASVEDLRQEMGLSR